MNWRSIPHPTYGNYGGYSKESTEKLPIDQMDYYFKIHDFELSIANNKLEKYEADSHLFENLKNVELNELARPIYGRIYWLGALLLFGCFHYFTKP